MGQRAARVFLVTFIAVVARGQVATPVPSFEVASIRLNQSGVRNGSMEFPKGGKRFTATNMPFGALVLVAYNITVRQLSGPPDFISQKYDVAAEAESAVKPDEMLGMLQTLLVDRFKLVVRHETKEVAVYALTIAKGGSRLHPVTPAEDAIAAPRTPSRAVGVESKSGYIFRNESMPDFAWALSRMAGIGDRVVVDDTGLKGTYDFDLTFGRDNAPSVSADGHQNAPRLEDPSIFSALQEQLGLKLESRKAPVDFLVIEHVERPTEN